MSSKERIIQYGKSAILAVALVAGLGFIQAWTGPPAGTPPACPSGSVGCDAPVNVSSNAQTKVGNFRTNANIIVDNDIWAIGTVQVGQGSHTAATCVAVDAGMLRWNGSALQYCPNGGGTWASFSSGSVSIANCPPGQVLQGIPGGTPTCVSSISSANTSNTATNVANIPSGTLGGVCEISCSEASCWASYTYPPMTASCTCPAGWTKIGSGTSIFYCSKN